MAKTATTSTTKKTTTKKATTKTTATRSRKKAIASTSVIQFQGLEFSENDCLKKAKAGFRKHYRGVELKDLKIYIKPE